MHTLFDFDFRYKLYNFESFEHVGFVSGYNHAGGKQSNSHPGIIEDNLLVAVHQIDHSVSECLNIFLLDELHHALKQGHDQLTLLLIDRVGLIVISVPHDML